MKKITFLLFFVLSSYFLLAYYPLKIETRLTNSNLKYLNADLYTRDTNLPKPVILIQTPYNKNLYHRWEFGNVDVPLIFDTLSYNYVIMDWRGFYSNKMADTAGYKRGLDGYDAVEWIAKRKWCNGKIGTWGGSALGQIQFLTAVEKPPHLVCAAPFIKDFKTKYEDFFYGGVYRKEHIETLINLGFMQDDRLIIAHPKKDLFWQSIEKLNDYSSKIAIPMLLATGWFDHYPGDVIRAFEGLQKYSEKKVRGQHKIIVGPWLHSKLGQVKQGVWKFPEAESEQEILAKSFFDYYLRNAKNGYPLKPKFIYFEMGDNQWLYADNWSDISRNYDTLYLRSNNRLLDTPPPPIMGVKDIPPDTIIYDPRNPSPTYGGARFNPFDLSVKLGPQDILQVVESRNDVLSYTSDYNKDGIVINGSVRIFLHVGSDRKDTDFGVRLTEVLRDGQSIILTQGIKRMRFRESLSEEILIEKDSIYIVEIDMEPLNIRLNKDSRLRIVVSSSNYPMFDINLNNGDELYKSGDTLIATNLVYRRNNSSSHIIIPFVDQATGIYDFTKKDKRAKVFPNPAYGFIFFDTDGKDMNFIIFNSIGIRVLSGNTKGSIDVSTLSAGVYFVMLGSADGRNNESVKFSIVR